MARSPNKDRKTQLMAKKLAKPTERRAIRLETGVLTYVCPLAVEPLEKMLSRAFEAVKRDVAIQLGAEMQGVLHRAPLPAANEDAAAVSLEVADDPGEAASESLPIFKRLTPTEMETQNSEHGLAKFGLAVEEREALLEKNLLLPYWEPKEHEQQVSSAAAKPDDKVRLQLLKAQRPKELTEASLIQDKRRAVSTLREHVDAVKAYAQLAGTAVDDPAAFEAQCFRTFLDERLKRLLLPIQDTNDIEQFVLEIRRRLGLDHGREARNEFNSTSRARQRADEDIRGWLLRLRDLQEEVAASEIPGLQPISEDEIKWKLVTYSRYPTDSLKIEFQDDHNVTVKNATSTVEQVRTTLMRMEREARTDKAATAESPVSTKMNALITTLAQTVANSNDSLRATASKLFTMLKNNNGRSNQIPSFQHTRTKRPRGDGVWKSWKDGIDFPNAQARDVSYHKWWPQVTQAQKEAALNWNASPDDRIAFQRHGVCVVCNALDCHPHQHKSSSDPYHHKYTQWCEGRKAFYNKRNEYRQQKKKARKTTYGDGKENNPNFVPLGS